PDLVAGSKAPRAATPAAVQQGLRWCLENNGPLDPQGFGHAGLHFPLGSSPGNGPIKRGMAGLLRRMGTRCGPGKSRAVEPLPNRSRTGNMKSIRVKEYGDAFALPRLSGGAGETGGYVGKAAFTVQFGKCLLAQGTEIGKPSALRAQLRTVFWPLPISLADT